MAQKTVERGDINVLFIFLAHYYGRSLIDNGKIILGFKLKSCNGFIWAIHNYMILALYLLGASIILKDGVIMNVRAHIHFCSQPFLINLKLYSWECSVTEAV